MKQRKMFGIVLALGVLTASLWGCAAAGIPDGTTRNSVDTTAPADTTAQTTGNTEAEDLAFSTLPAIEIPDMTMTPPATGGFAGTAVSVSASQQRLDTVRSGWADAFNGNNGCFLIADSVTGLTEALSYRGGLDTQVDLSEFDDAFFEENRLVVIPRSTNSGSVRYEASISAEDNAIGITLQGKVDGIGTGDMADWLVFVVLPLKDYPVGLTVTVAGSAGNANGGLTS